MRQRLSITLLLAAGCSAAPRDRWDPTDRWAAWNTFDVGAWRAETVDTDAGSRRVKTILVEKQTNQIRLRQETIGHDATSTRILILSPDGTMLDESLRFREEIKGAKIEVPSVQREREEVVEIDGQRLRCRMLDYGTSEDGSRFFRTWHCRDVPGWIVRLESQMGCCAGRQFTSVTGFGAK